jgi:hypothetical protein
MGSIFQGGALPDVKTTTSVNPNAPSYYTDYMSALSKAGTQQLGLPASQLVAGFSPLQQQAFAQLPNVAGSYKPALTSAINTASQGAAGITPQGIQSMLNPYTKNVVDEMARLTNQNVQKNVVPQLKGAFVGSGGLGGQRYANAAGQTMADIQSNLTGQQQGALSSGYSEALRAALSNAQQKTNAAQVQGGLAKTQQDLGLAGINAQLGAGAQQQALEQARINAPLQNAVNASSLMRGYNVPIGTTETFVGPKAGVYSNSPLSQITGSGAFLTSLFGGSGKDGLGPSVIDRLFKSPPGSGGSGGGFKFPNVNFGGGSGGGGGPTNDYSWAPDTYDDYPVYVPDTYDDYPISVDYDPYNYGYDYDTYENRWLFGDE